MRAHPQLGSRPLQRRRAVHARAERRLFTVVAIVAALLAGLGGTVFAYLNLSAAGPSSAKAATLSAPSGLSATATSGKVTLSWSDTAPWTTSTSAPGVKYLVYRCTGTGCNASSTIATGGCATTSPAAALSTPSCTDTSVTASTTYGYAVVAVYDTWVSPPSSTEHVTTPSMPTIASSVVAYNNDASYSTSIQTDKPGSHHRGGEVTFAPSTDYLVFVGETRCTSHVTAPRLSFQTASQSFATVTFVSTTTPTTEYFTAAHAVEEWVYTVKAGPGASGHAKVMATFTTSSASQCCAHGQRCCGQGQSRDCCAQGPNQQWCGQDQNQHGQNQDRPEEGGGQCCGQGSNAAEPDARGGQCCAQYSATRSYLWVVKLTNVTLSRPVLTTGNYTGTSTGKGSESLSVTMASTPPGSDATMVFLYADGNDATTPTSSTGMSAVETPTATATWTAHDTGSAGLWFKSSATKQETFTDLTTSATWFALSLVLNDPPTVTGVSPDHGSTTGGTPVVITGTGFTKTAVVVFGTVPATDVTVNSSTSITALTPAHTAGSLAVSVTTQNGTSLTSAGDQFTYATGSTFAPTPPSVTSLSPATGPVAGGTPVTITGANFTPTAKVSFGVTAAASVTVNSPTSITVLTPAHTAGSLAVSVTTQNGTSLTAAGDQFTYTTGSTVTGSVG